MSFDDFKGEAKTIDDIDLPRIGAMIGVGEDEIHAVIDVEAAGGGFDRSGRPKMLFEPHIFYRELSGGQRTRAVSEGLAYPKWKRSYPKDSYPRLKKAMKINETAALRSASWGMGQIMGFNHQAAGYDAVEDMVRAFMEDEENHLEAMINFIIDKNLDDELRNHNWRGFARGYNGSGYAKNGYHTKLERAYRKWKNIKNTPWEPGQVEERRAPAGSASAGESIRASSKIYLFRGLFGIGYSRGLHDIAASLEAIGFETSVHWYGAGDSVSKQIEQEFRSGRFSNFAVIGHSLGANAALRVSNKLSAMGIPIAYVASLDPTLRFNVSGFKADNFRSRDFRDKPVGGANEIPRDDLSHIELDDDPAIQNRIIAMCRTCLRGETVDLETKMERKEDTTQRSEILNDETLALILAIIAARKGGGAGENSEILDYLCRLAGEHGDLYKDLPDGVIAAAPPIAKVKEKEPLTPVNRAFGDTIGHMLNGRKSAIGIIGLLATYLIPTLAPGSTVLVDILQAIGLGGETITGADATPAKSIFGPIFTAMLGWGGLGKLDKWVAKLRGIGVR